MALNLKGLEGLQSQLESLGEELRAKVLRRAMRAAFKPVLEDAKARAPIDSGELREAITLGSAKGPKDSFQAVGLMVVANSTGAKQARLAAAAFGEAQSKALPPARRWHFIELGTARQAPQPFLRPAMDANAQRVLDGLKTEIQKKVRSALKRSKR